MQDLAEARERWLALKDSYQEFGEYAVDCLRKRIAETGTPAFITSRAKEIDSFLKKIIRKKINDPLDEMHDMVGVRIVVPFVSQLETIGNIITNTFDVHKFEDKSEGLGDDRFAYQSWHYDVKLKDPLDSHTGNFRGMWCEIQLRTECQHLWASMVDCPPEAGQKRVG